MISNRPDDLKRIYRARFEARAAYRQRVWSVLIERFFGRFVAQGDAVLDLGCGYGEFINNVSCAHKVAMDLNPDAKIRLRENVILFEQDCSQRWPLEEASLEVVFTSNFFEDLPSKEALGRTLDEACRCLKPGGRLIAMGPNIKYVPGAYWDFWDPSPSAHRAIARGGVRDSRIGYRAKTLKISALYHGARWTTTGVVLESVSNGPKSHGAFSAGSFF